MSTRIYRNLKNTALGMGLGLAAMPAFAVELSSDVQVVVCDDIQLDSVLVSSRLASEDEAESMKRVPLLEPISQVSEYEPELAEPLSVNDVRSVEHVASLPSNKAKSAKVDPDQSRFHGVQAGLTTLDELLTEWGDPATRFYIDGESKLQRGEVLQYDIEPFANVETLVEDELVQVVRVTLSTPSTIESLVETLSLEDFENVEVIDNESGDMLAVTVPEKGLTMLTESGTAPGASKVTHLVLQTLDSHAFAMRAEQRGPTQCSKNLDDLERSISIDANNAHAHWLKGKTLRLTGQAEDAELAAAEAVRLDPSNHAHLLLWAQCLADLNKHDEAVLKTRKVIDETASDLVRAEAFHNLGLLAAIGDSSIADKAIGFHNSAITLADKLATSSDDIERRAAKDLLIDAHLAIANRIAERDYPEKTETVAQWIGRASGLAEERISNDGGGLELRLLVAREALGALAELRPALDPKPWIEEAEATARLLRDEVTDPLFLSKIEWDLGVAHQYAVRIEHARGNKQEAIDQGSKAIDALSAGAEPRTSHPMAEQVVGELYFYIGAINAVHFSDHEEAVAWYNKSRPILSKGKPESDFRVDRNQGERFVSMAVSYWEVGEKDLALELTESGAQQMLDAANAGVMPKSNLKVPYGNLRMMYSSLGNKSESSRYTELFVSHGGVVNKPAKTSVARKPAKEPTKTARSESGPTRTARHGRPTARSTMKR